MIKPYEFLESILTEIENSIKDNIKIDLLAKKYCISSIHLQRLFKFAFNQSIGGYIRSRKLSASLNDLFKNDFNILDIAIEYGFEYEETYIRAFKREFGTTPGVLRKTGEVVKVTSPLHIFNAKKAEDGIFFRPDIVMVPKFHIIGKHHKIQGCDVAALAPKLAIEFWNNERKLIKNSTNQYVFISLARNYNKGNGYTDYLPSIPVNNIDSIPSGLKSDTFESSLCIRFRYIGQHHYFDLNAERMKFMYEEIWKFYYSEQEKYALLNDKVYFQKVDIRQYDGTYCQMEVFIPIEEKSKMI